MTDESPEPTLEEVMKDLGFPAPTDPTFAVPELPADATAESISAEMLKEAERGRRFIGQPQADAIIQEMIDDGAIGEPEQRATPSAEERTISGGASE